MSRMNMMDQFQVAAEEDDMYGGFGNQVDENDTLTSDPAFQQAVRTSHGRRPPPTAARLRTGVRGNVVPPSSMGRPGPSSLGRLMTGATDGAARPMTAVRGAGYSSLARGVGYDSGKSAAPALEGKGDDTPEEKIRQMEKRVNELIEESCTASANADYQTALEKAKEAGRKEKLLVREREKLANTDQINLDLTYSALFNLANQYTLNEMYNEALNTYQIIVKNKMFSMAGRLKVNMGNIYFKQRQYSKAIKFYRMALDQIPNTHRGMRIKVMHNISVCFVKLGQYNDAVTSLEVIMQEEPDMRTGLNLVLCYFALGDKEKMKKTFQRMLTVDLKIDDDEKYTPHPDDAQHTLILEVIKNDSLRQIERDRRNTAERCIKTAAKLISPAIESSFTAGYDWCMDQVKTSNFMELAHDLEIDKAIGYLKKKDFAQAVDALKSFEKKDTKVACTAATNLSFLYYVESDLNQADKYADLALTADKYNPPALVNKGNIYFKRRDYEKAREFYKEALQNDSSCVEALYNAGLCNKKLKRYKDAMDSFYKLHTILRNNGQVLYQIADLHDLMGESAQAQEMFMQLLGVVPTDAAILARLGQMFDAENDKAQAFQYNYDSYRYNPSNIKIIEWLGGYYIESQFCEKAIQYFERGAIIQPSQVKWQLMVASCHRRSGNYQQALDTYKLIHKRFPDNIECLKFLVRISSDMGLKESADYATKLKKAEKNAKLREDRINSGRRKGSGRNRQFNDRQDSAGSERNATGRAGHERAPITEPGSDLFADGDKKAIDTTYADPLGPAVERPKTAATRRKVDENEFEDEELGEDLLPV